MKTNKGYLLTEEQSARRADLERWITPGPAYRRDIRDSLSALQYAEDSAQADYWLEQAERQSYEYR